MHTQSHLCIYFPLVPMRITTFLDVDEDIPVVARTPADCHTIVYSIFLGSYRFDNSLASIFLLSFPSLRACLRHAELGRLLKYVIRTFGLARNLHGA